MARYSVRIEIEGDVKAIDPTVVGCLQALVDEGASVLEASVMACETGGRRLLVVPPRTASVKSVPAALRAPKQQAKSAEIKNPAPGKTGELDPADLLATE